MTIKDKKIFLTGGAGFIGSSIVGRLVQDNEIVVYDTLQRNALKGSACKDHPNIRLVQGDVLDLGNLKAAIKGCDIVIHLAAIAGVDTVLRSPTRTMRTNLTGTANVLEAANTLDRLERLVNFSTSEVYGTYAYKMQESDSTNMGAVGESRWTYAISKLASEYMALSYFKEYGMPVVSLRPFNIYGPGQVGEGAIHSFVTRALKGETLQIKGDGDQIRSWCFVDDIVDGILLCLENDKSVGETFNIGNPRGTITILSLAEKIIGMAGSKSRIEFVPKDYVDVELRIPSIEKAKVLLGYTPKYSLDDGLKRTIKWYSGN